MTLKRMRSEIFSR